MPIGDGFQEFFLKDYTGCHQMSVVRVKIDVESRTHTKNWNLKRFWRNLSLYVCEASLCYGILYREIIRHKEGE